MAVAQTFLNGTSLAMRSQSSPTLGSTGFVGTYLVVPAGGATVNLKINATAGASGAGDPHMQLVIADSAASFSIGSASPTDYTTQDITLPAGTYLVRNERDFSGNVNVTRPFTVNNLTVNTVSGNAATFSNINNGTISLAAADSYINNFRKGTANVAVRGPGNIPLLAGTPVNVDLKRIGFNFGNAVPGTSTTGVNNYLGVGSAGVGTTTQQIQYQQRLLQNFNSIVPENVGKWSSTEGSRDTQTMTGVDTMLRYAQNNHMSARMHNLIWGNTGQTPSFVNTMLTNPNGADASPPLGTGSTNTNKLGLWGSTDGVGNPNSEIAERIKYYVSDNNALTGTPRSSQYGDVDVYNESYHTGETQANSFWQNYSDVNGPTGIAQIYKAVKTAGPNVTPFVNEYNVYVDGGDKFANWYQTHTDKLRKAGFANGLGDVVGGIGTQYYPNNNTPSLADPSAQSDSLHNPARMMMTLQNLSTEGLPIVLTEFGVKPPGGTGAGGASMSFNATTQQNAANMLSDSLRMVFGNANSTGFMMWGFQAEGSGSTFGTNLYQSESALYTVLNSGTTAWAAGSWTITPAGKVWQTLLGIQNWASTGSDGAALGAWTTHLAGLPVDADGNIAFDGFYGDYNIGNQSAYSNLALVKGTTGYSLNLAAPPTWFFWKTTNSGSWSSASNWTTAVPGAMGDTAYFGSAAAPRSINVDGGKTVGMLAFDSAQPYTIGGSTITLDGFVNSSAIYVAAGSHQIDAPISPVDSLSVNVAPAASTLTLTNLQASNVNITKAGVGTLIANNIRAAGLIVASGTLKIAPNGTSAATSNLSALSMGGPAALDLTNNAMVLNYSGASPLETVEDLIKSGAANDFTGSGITSSTAAAVAIDNTNPHKTAIGFGEASALGLSSFQGQSIPGNAIVMRYTLLGDANLDGIVNALDFNALATSFGETDSTWINADFNYDGSVNTLDFDALAINFNTVLPAPALGSLVPEPAVLLIPLLLTLRRRRCAGC